MFYICLSTGERGCYDVTSHFGLHPLYSTPSPRQHHIPWTASPSWIAPTETAPLLPRHHLPSGQHYPLDSTTPWTAPHGRHQPSRQHHPSQSTEWVVCILLERFLLQLLNLPQTGKNNLNSVKCKLCTVSENCVKCDSSTTLS